ncbi:nucleolar protein 6 [Diabrotica undecimpunctata]|uniref:nucleolar protein 6 n=1 Tax=Diabrotica undecimpunctata TaxID=50387 RepID=UPI003B6404F2
MKNMDIINDINEDWDSESEDEAEIANPVQESKESKRKYEDIPATAVSPPKKKHKNELYKPPTVEELNNLREVENLYNNNLFRLQITELLNEIKIKTKRKTKLAQWLTLFNNTLESFPIKKLQLSELERLGKQRKKLSAFLKRITAHKRIFETDQDISLSFDKPESVQYFGLYENNCLPGPNLSLNINLVMPQSAFLTKDYLNNRYLVKRWYYLLYIAEYLKQKSLVVNTEIVYDENNHMCPIIKLQPKDCDKTDVFVYISPQNETFKCPRFLTEQNNVKVDLFECNINLDTLKNSPTILYNSLLAHDVTLYDNNEFVKEVLKDHEHVQDGIKLLCVWVNQRELNIGFGAFTERLVLCLVAYLVHKKKITKFMSSYQVVRYFWNYLSTTDLLTENISITEVSSEILTNFRQHFDVVFLDKTGCYNLTSFLTKDMYKKVKLESQVAIKHLDENRIMSFRELFLTKYPFQHQYDLVIDLSSSLSVQNKFEFSDEEKSTHIGYENVLIFNHITNMLNRALNKRICNIVPRIELCGTDIKSFLLGINLNPNEAFNFIDKGPALEKFEEAAEFRNFWGHLATDRRFRDGSINVAVYFRTNTIRAKRNIIKKIISFVLEEKLQLQFKIFYDKFEDVMLFKRLVPNYPSGTNEETCLKIIHASDALSKMLRELQLSLKITGVQGASDVFAYAQPFPPIPANFQADSSIALTVRDNIVFNIDQKFKKMPRYVQTVDCVLQLELSSKWPNDLQALRHIKTSFYLEIAKLLKDNHGLLTHPTPGYLDVFYQGIVFRYRLFVSKEVGLVKKIHSEGGLTSYKDSLESYNMEMSLSLVPKIIGGLRGIQSSYPSYGPGTALIKRWLRAHLLDEFHISDLVINLLAASLYLNENSPNPVTPQKSFLRFLKFLSETDFTLYLVIVNFNEDLSKDDIATIESEVTNNRNSFPNLCIVTPYDHFSTITKNAPSKQILNRIKLLATESLKFIDQIIVGQNNVGIKELFIPNFQGFNVLIYIKRLFNSRRHEQIALSAVQNRTVVEKYAPNNYDRIPIVNFDPVADYLKTLRDNYGKYALFFHDSYGGNVIGVLWHPRVFETCEFKVNKINGGKLEDDKVVFNFDAVIEDFFVLGRSLVKDIEKK